MTPLLLAVTLAASGPVAPSRPVPSGMARVGPGIYRPVYPPSPKEKEIHVGAFLMDALPVTNVQFLAFVEAHPRWQRGVIPALFADEKYMARWASPTNPGPGALPDQPVTDVSWFAAKACCESMGKTLPTENQWEFAASADERRPDARADPEFTRRILQWYSQPNPERLPHVGRNPPDYWGVSDLHGLVWEWVLDFSASMVSNDNRENGGADRTRFCGAAALSAADKSDYAAFMRIAFRSSLKARDTTSNLGFRCVLEDDE